MSDRTTIRETAIAVALSAIAGYVDAIGFTRLWAVFPANQSGNLVLFGIGVGDPGLSDAWRPALTMAGFVVGVAVAFQAGRRIPARRRVTALLLIEALGLAAVALLAGDVAGLHAPVPGTKTAVALAIASVIMGLQTDVLRLAAGVSVATTYETGALVRLTESASDAALQPGATPRRQRRVLIVLSSVVALYAGGAAIGARVAQWWGGALWIAAALALVVAIGASLMHGPHDA